MKTLISALTIASMALAASFAMAQGTPGQGPGMGGQGMGPGMGGHGMGPGMDDRASREQMKAAYEACKDKADRHACMTEQFCAASADAAKCRARAKEHLAHMSQRIEQQQMMHEACNGKRGEELSKCLHEQHRAQRNRRLDEHQKAHEACGGKRGDELAKCLHEQMPRHAPRAKA